MYTDVPEHISDVIRAAAEAPSGDNSQPWRFVYCPPNTIKFYAILDRDNPILNVDNSGTLIALGAAVENASVKAKALGFDANIDWYHEGAHIATMRLRARSQTTSAGEIALADAIPKRHSNRKTYQPKALSTVDRDALLDAVRGIPGVTIVLIENIEERASLARALTTMEEVALANRTIHGLFFKSIFWSKKRNDSGESGLYIDTLELPPPAKVLFRALRFWPVASLLATLGFPKGVAAGNAKQNASASAIVLIMAKSLDRGTFLSTGRAVEEIWLTATMRNMACQIVTGMLFMARRVQKKGDDTVFSTEEEQKILRAYESARRLAGLDAAYEPILALRVGYADAPTAYAHRKDPQVEVRVA